MSGKQKRIDKKRYKKVRRFFIGVFLEVIFWDVVMNRPVLRRIRPSMIFRWKRIARRFRNLAVEMGGVLIKLGQFLSIRVDILPAEVVSELSGLQDKVPPVHTEEIIQKIEAETGQPVSDFFSWFSGDPLGAASLAQVHRVRLKDGKDAVVKVLRPRIEILVETDLSAIAMAIRLLKYVKRVKKRVDLDWLVDEFSTVTRDELDLVKEGKNVERFARDFKDSSDVYLPEVYWDYTSKRILVMENVGYIKIGDRSAIESAGISPVQVADKLYNIYMKQVFENFFVHVDPHPGNLFVRPLPVSEEKANGVIAFKPGDMIPRKSNRPFQIVFVDFGMTSVIPERLRTSIREFAVGLGTYDAHKIVQSYVKGGTLLKGADLKRLEEVHEAFFENFWGVRVGEFKDIAFKGESEFFKEYREMIYEFPFQFQVDMLFVVRAVGILSGMAAHLDPEFDPWTKTVPFAEKYAREEMQKNWREIVYYVADIARKTFRLPLLTDDLFTGIKRERLTFRTSWTKEDRRALKGIENAVERTGWFILTGAFLLTGVLLPDVNGRDRFFFLLIFCALLAFVRGIRAR